MADVQKLWTLAQAASETGLPLSRLHAFTRSGALPVVRFNHERDARGRAKGRLFVRPSDLAKLIDANVQNAEGAKA